MRRIQAFFPEPNLKHVMLTGETDQMLSVEAILDFI